MTQKSDPLAEIRERLDLVFGSLTALDQARAVFLGEWYRAVATMSDAELRAFQAEMQQRMTIIAQSPLARGGRS